MLNQERNLAMSKPRMAVLSATGTAKKRTIPAVLQEGICEIISVQGRDESKLKTLAEEYSIPNYFVDPRRLLKAERPDFVFIGSPAFLHAEQISLCLEVGVPVLCEKPLALHSDVSKRIRTEVRHSGIPVRIAHHLRHQPGVKALHDLLTNQRLGSLRRASLQWSFWLNSEAPNAKWKLDPETGGANAFYDAGIHAVDMMIHLFPRPSALVALGGPSRFPQTVDNVSVLLSCSDAIVEINSSHSVRFPTNSLVCDCEGGTISIAQAFSEKAFTEMHLTTSEGALTERYPSVNPYAEEVRDFVGLLAGDSSVGTTIDEAHFGVAILDAIERSRSSGIAVSLPEE
jgi:predicted dehydrogenase